MARSKKLSRASSSLQSRYGGLFSRHNWQYAANSVNTIVNAGQAISQGYDMVKTQTGTKKKSYRGLPKTLAHGWYVDTMSGLNHKFPQSWNSVIKNNGRFTVKTQLPSKQDAILSRINKSTLINHLPLTTIQAITDPGVTTYLTTARWKTMWTNMSNVKICYEYYYVTPIGDQANTFQVDLEALTNILDVSSGLMDVYTSWKPQETPELMKNWRILSKSVFRLSPGETGELHGKDNIYKQFGDAVQTTGRTHESSINTQLYVRWYGCPTGVITTAAPTIVTDATFGDASLATTWITETSFSYYKADSINAAGTTWSSTVLASISGAQTVVTHQHNDQDLVTAE